jgi:hypothetical protein
MFDELRIVRKEYSRHNFEKQMNWPIQDFAEAPYANSSIPNDNFSENDNLRLKPLNDQKPMRQRQGGITNIFPIKLFSMLQDIKINESFSDIVKWSENGDAFVILNPQKFTVLLLPVYFRTKKFSSFQRQLNAYGFTKFNLYACQEDVHVYYHRLFHRDNANNIKLVRRKNVFKSIHSIQCKRRQKIVFAGETKLPKLSSKMSKLIQNSASFNLELANFDIIRSLSFCLSSKTTNRSQDCVLRDLDLDQAAEDVWEHDATSSREMMTLFKEWDPISEVLSSDGRLGRLESVPEYFHQSKADITSNLEDQRDWVIEELDEARIMVWNPIPLSDETFDNANLERKSFSIDEWYKMLELVKKWNTRHEYSESAAFQENLDRLSGNGIVYHHFEIP